MSDISFFMNKYKYSTLFYNGTCEHSEYVEKVETQKSTIWIINPNKILLKNDLLEKLDNEKLFVHEIDGIWSCIIQDKTTREIRAISSINNELPWYYKEKPFVISNSIFLIAGLANSRELDEVSIATFLSFDHTFGGSTFIKGIKKAYGGDILIGNTNSFRIVKNDLQKWLGFDDSIEDRKLLVEQFVSSMKKSLKDPSPEISLTAGSDSRVVLAGGLLSGEKFNLMTGTAPSTDRRDVKVAGEIAKILNIKHIQTDASKRNIENLDEVMDRMTIETNAEFIPRNWIIFLKEYILDQDNLKNRSKLQGYGGEIFKGFYSNLTRSLSRKTAFLNKNNKELVIEKALSSYKYYKDISNVNSLNLFYQRERAHFWASMNMRTSLSYVKTYSPILSSDLLGLGYRMKGGIMNSKFHETMLSTLPEHIRNIPFNYTKVEAIFRYLRNSINRKVSYDLILKPDFIRNKIDYDIFKNIIPASEIKKLIHQYEKRGMNAILLHKIFAISNFNKLLNR